MPTGRQVDSLTSNIGHLLWSGIVDKAKAEAVVAHLMGPELFSGWGMRTLADGEGGYNPIGYHVGTVWPFDNSFIAWGLRRYGFKEEAARDRGGHPRGGRSSSRAAARGLRAVPARADQVSRGVPDGLQPAGLVDRARRSCCCGRCWASNRSVTTSRRSRAAVEIGHLELLDIPAAGAAWTRSDAAASPHATTARCDRTG